MSADNGIYILMSPIEGSSEVEYRVADAAAIDNLNYFAEGSLECQAMEVVYFGNSTVFVSETDAFHAAITIQTQTDWTEYGICILTEREFPFSKMTVEEAHKILKF